MEAIKTIHIWGESPKGDKGEIRKERSIAEQPKTGNVNSDVLQSIEIGKLNCMANGKIVDLILCCISF